jgi:hypothetical protein
MAKKKTLAEKFSEAINRPVPDETLTVAWWDFDDVAEVAEHARLEPSDSNPSHQEDFTRLKNVAAKKREPRD